MRYANDFGFYDLTPLPGCPQVIVSTHVFIHPQFRGQGHGKIQHEARLKEMVRLGYDYALCTVRSDNEPQLRILARQSWKALDSFNNTVSGHHVMIFGRSLASQGLPPTQPLDL